MVTKFQISCLKKVHNIRVKTDPLNSMSKLERRTLQTFTIFLQILICKSVAKGGGERGVEGEMYICTA
jgi:hypothetical protein